MGNKEITKDELIINAGGTVYTQNPPCSKKIRLYSYLQLDVSTFNNGRNTVCIKIIDNMVFVIQNLLVCQYIGLINIKTIAINTNGIRKAKATAVIFNHLDNQVTLNNPIKTQHTSGAIAA